MDQDSSKWKHISFADDLQTQDLTKEFWTIVACSHDVFESPNWICKSIWVYFATQLKDSSNNAAKYPKLFDWEFNSSAK